MVHLVGLCQDIPTLLLIIALASLHKALCYSCPISLTPYDKVLGGEKRLISGLSYCQLKVELTESAVFKSLESPDDSEWSFSTLSSAIIYEGFSDSLQNEHC